MPFKRPAPAHQASSGYSSRSDSAADENRPSKRQRLGKQHSALSSIRLFIVQAKLEGPTIAELFSLAEQHCKRLVSEPQDADVIVTAITMRKRFERTVPWTVAVSLLSSEL